MVIKKVHKKVLLIGILLVGGLSTQLSFGYSMYLGEAFIGNVHTRREAYAITDILEDTSGITAPETSLYLKLLPKNTFHAPREVLTSLRNAHHVETEIQTEISSVPYETEIIKCDSMYQGERIKETAGVAGERTVILEKTIKEGEVLSQTILSDIVTREPVNEIIKEGVKSRPKGTGTGSFSLPLSEIRVSSSFGTRWNRQHAGVDLAAEAGTDILASDSGTVIFSGESGGYGNLIILDHQNGYKTYYAHASKLYLGVGEKPDKGEVIAAVGSTGNSTGPHLHFEIRKEDVPQNPADYLAALQ